jgi:uncharacterized protein involved in response to NO
MMPCHHALAEALHAYIAAVGIAADNKAFLFRTSRGHTGTVLSDQPMTQVHAWRMVRKRALTAWRRSAATVFGQPASRRTLENAQVMAAHESPRTTKLYDRTGDEITLDEIERIAI